ncbi:hypothetical protein ACFSM5_04260 [Lacibacterium aquatile]|uniref:Uncharacterized protein n=1 Tax=Lacibacterium aquatile TaxID=1168082 RepID=A0ABW5DS23_9PROT
MALANRLTTPHITGMRSLALLLLLTAATAALPPAALAQTYWDPAAPAGNPASSLTPPSFGAITPPLDRNTSDRLNTGIGNSQFQQQLLRPQPGASWEEQRRMEVERDRLRAEQARIESERRRLDPTRP